MVNSLPEPARRVRAAARALGLDIAVRTMPGSTHTAADAAAALGCDLGQVVKSLVFRGRDSGRPHLLLVSGKNRVDQEGAAAFTGEPLERTDPAYVCEATGFPVGGVPPLGHRTLLPVWFDRDLLVWDIVWAAAGTADTMFEVQPDRLRAATEAIVVSVA
jgi:prolyl-tRNA editing enzyme YbaK/EbsC (Cys-tRNA(Pro) deacylase)